MDADRFDFLARSITIGSSRRGVLTGLASGLLAALPLALSGEDADAKKKKRKKKKPKPSSSVCNPNCNDRTCGSDGCGGSCGECGANQLCQGGTCCTPEPVAATCGGRCGTWPNNCGQSVACLTCSSGQVCLSNGSCAIVADEPSDCPSGCVSGGPTTEGEFHCEEGTSNPPCSTHPSCTNTAQCPLGTHCSVACAGSPKCLPLCSA